MTTKAAQQRIDHLRARRVIDHGRRNCRVRGQADEGPPRVRLVISLAESQLRMMRGRLMDCMGFA